MRQAQMQFGGALTPMVKRLIFANVGIWLGLVIVVQQYFMSGQPLFSWFGMTPVNVLFDFWIWQPFTYMFLHSYSPLHIVFNMLLLYWLGSELEQHWGSRFFLSYYVICGVGAAVIYLLGSALFFAFTNNASPLQHPVIGASGAVFGLLLAYGIVFGEREMLFMFVFPMKAKYLVMIMGAIEMVTLLNSGMTNDVANLAHLGGLITGFLFLWFWTRRKISARKSPRSGNRRRLKLVVDNEKNDTDGPRYWN